MDIYTYKVCFLYFYISSTFLISIAVDIKGYFVFRQREQILLLFREYGTANSDSIAIDNMCDLVLRVYVCLRISCSDIVLFADVGVEKCVNIFIASHMHKIFVYGSFQ